MQQTPGLFSTAARLAFSLLLLGAVAVLIYANTFQAPFVYDDRFNITENPAIRMTELSWAEVIERLKGRAVNSANRPFAALTIALNYYFHQYQVAGYHVVNLLIHIITAFLVYLLTRQTMALWGKELSYLPFWAALSWLVNPLHTQSVTYIVQRMNSLAALFYLSALVCYVQARWIQRRHNTSGFTPSPLRRRRIKAMPVVLFFFSAISAVLALASKEIAATLPILLFVYEWYFFQNLSRTWLKRRIKWIGGGVVILLVIAFVYLNADPIQRIISTYENKPFTPGERLLSQSRVILYYLSLLIYPHPSRLNLLYDFPMSGSASERLTTGMSVMALMALVVFVGYAARKHRLISFAVVWFLVTLSVESSIIGLEPIYEHRTYLPSTFLFIAGIWWLFQSTRPRQAAIPVIIVAVIVCGAWTWQRNHAWGDESRLWRDVIAKTPFNADGYESLGLVLQKAGDYQGALACFERAARFGKSEPYDFTPLYLGTALIQLGRFQEAIPHLTDIVSRNVCHGDDKDLLELALPDDPFYFYQVRELYKKAYLNLGIAWQRSGNISNALRYYRYALGVDPLMAAAWNNMGNAFFSQGDIPQAMVCFQKALAVDPAYDQAGVNLKRVAEITDIYGPAMERLKDDAERHPDNALTAYQLARVYQAAGMIDKAIRQLRQTLSLDPAMTAPLNMLAGLYADTGQLEKATETVERLARLLPDNATVFYNLACLYARQEQVDRAVNALKTAVEKGYDHWSHLRSDTDLANIKGTPYYRELTSAIGP